MSSKPNDKPSNIDPITGKRRRKPHSAETKARIREKRLLRCDTNPPRHAGQSKKRKSLYEELVNDYKKYPEAVDWLNQHKHELGWVDNPRKRENALQMIATSKEWGIQTEYTDMYEREYEKSVGSILYDEHDVDKANEENDNLIEEIDEKYGDSENEW